MGVGAFRSEISSYKPCSGGLPAPEIDVNQLAKGFAVQDPEFSVRGFSFRLPGAGFSVHRAGFRVSESHPNPNSTLACGW